MQYVVKKWKTEQYFTASGQLVSLQFATVFSSHARAVDMSRKHGGSVELYLGRPNPQGTKFFTTGKQSKINRRSAYRNI